MSEWPLKGTFWPVFPWQRNLKKTSNTFYFLFMSFIIVPSFIHKLCPLRNNMPHWAWGQWPIFIIKQQVPINSLQRKRTSKKCTSNQCTGQHTSAKGSQNRNYLRGMYTFPDLFIHFPAGMFSLRIIYDSSLGGRHLLMLFRHLSPAVGFFIVDHLLKAYFLSRLNWLEIIGVQKIDRHGYVLKHVK